MSTKTATVLDHTVDGMVLPGILPGPLPEHTRIYLDLLGAKYIPVFKDGTMNYVLSRDAGALCERYGLIVGRRTNLPSSPPLIRSPFDGIHIEDFYYSLTPHHHLVFGLHGIKFTNVEYNGVKIWVYEKAVEAVCRRFATNTKDPNRVPSAGVVVRTHSVRLSEYVTDLPDVMRSYYELLGVDFVAVRTPSGDLHHIPIKYMDLVCDRLNLYA